MIKKPNKETLEYYSYTDCRDYLQKKYKFQERGFLGFGDERIYWSLPDEERREQTYNDFWHFVVETFSEIRNGAYVEVSEDRVLDNVKFNWQWEIAALYFKEFGEGSEGGRSIIFYFWW